MILELLLFVATAFLILFSGTKLSRIADRLADITGFGEALLGGVLLGACTSLSGSTLSVISAYDGFTELAVGNAIGGIAAQTFFLCLVDIWYKKANLEHAAVSSTNILLTALLISLLVLPIAAQGLSATTYFGIHPVTPFMFLAYAWGVRFCHAEKEDPMWRPRLTRETVQDLPDESSKDRKTKGLLWVQFFILVILLAFSGYLLEKSGVALAKAWGIRTVILGTFLTAVITSLPELVITFAAVKRGALTLAVGGIVGGNSFDVLFLGFSDLAYREGSIYHTLSSDQLSYLGLTILMNAVLLMGLIRREKSGPANIGTESLLIGILYIFGLFVLF